MYAAIVAIDRRRVDLRFIAGTDEPASKSVPREHRPGVIPAADHPDLLAVFNGGFMAKHGAGNAHRRRHLPPAQGRGLHGGLRQRRLPPDPHVDGLAPAAATIDAFRQTPPCLLEQGAMNPLLESDPKTKRWGSRRRARSRSAAPPSASTPAERLCSTASASGSRREASPWPCEPQARWTPPSST